MCDETIHIFSFSMMKNRAPFSVWCNYTNFAVRWSSTNLSSSVMKSSFTTNVIKYTKNSYMLNQHCDKHFFPFHYLSHCFHILLYMICFRDLIVEHMFILLMFMQCNIKVDVVQRQSISVQLNVYRRIIVSLLCVDICQVRVICSVHLQYLAALSARREVCIRRVEMIIFS